MTQLPTVIEAEAVDTIAHWIDLVAQLLTAEVSRLVLRKHIRERLLQQEAVPMMQVVAAAEAGHQDADLALRELAAEYVSRREEMPAELANYVQRALLQPAMTYPRGRNIADTWLRDVGIAVLVALAVDRWHLRVTRNEATRRPSACFLVAAALHRRGYKIGERQVERIVRAHSRLAQRLSASIPPV
jgi:hypothetical protein